MHILVGFLFVPIRNFPIPTLIWANALNEVSFLQITQHSLNRFLRSIESYSVLPGTFSGKLLRSLFQDTFSTQKKSLGNLPHRFSLYSMSKSSDSLTVTRSITLNSMSYKPFPAYRHHDSALRIKGLSIFDRGVSKFDHVVPWLSEGELEKDRTNEHHISILYQKISKILQSMEKRPS